jgi:serine/threonine protein kinase
MNGAHPRACPSCGARLPHDAPAGNCPRCLLDLGLDLGADGREMPELPRLFGGYELLEEIARGGMGVVYRARQVELNRVVAVKLLLHGPFADPSFVRRFRAEAQAAAGLQHPNIVAIHEVGEQDGCEFFSMDFVDGQSLSALVREHPLPAAVAARHLKAIAEAIHFAHQRGILHRDLRGYLGRLVFRKTLKSEGVTTKTSAGSLQSCGSPIART